MTRRYPVARDAPNPTERAVSAAGARPGSATSGTVEPDVGFLSALLRHSSDAAIVVHSTHGVVYASPAIAEVLGVPPDRFLGRMASDWIHPDDVPSVIAHREAATVTGHAGPIIIRGRHADDTWRSFEAEWWQPDDTTIDGTILHFRDVSEREAARAAADRSEARLNALLLEAADVVFVLPRDGSGLTYVSPSVTRVMGWPAEEAGEMRWAEVIHPEHLPRWIDAVRSAYAEAHGTQRIEIRALHRDGSWRWLDATLLNRTDDPLIDGVILHFHDVTARHLAEQELARRALHDDLTGLPNRALLVDRLQNALGRAARDATMVAVFYCDMDHFKHVNDSIGHRAADDLLREVARRLGQVVRAGDTVARLHGDEFVVCADEIESLDEVRALGERIRIDLSAPFQIADREVHVSVSVGVAIGSTVEDAEELLERADAAMYVAKADGRDRLAIYDQTVRDRELSILAIRNDLRRAVDESELCLHYQPVYDLASGRIVGTEALVRWLHPEHGLMPPSEFIPVAEESGAIVALGAWVLETAAAQARAWGFGTTRDATMWVNVSPRQLIRPEIVDVFTSTIAESGAPPAAIGLEVTETANIESQPALAARLARLRALGCSIAIDDFGTGYSSLLYLRRYAADTIKIDRSFIAGLGTNRDDSAIVTSVRLLAEMLGLRVVAEGVETLEQLDALRGIGCQHASGYLLAEPAAPEVIEPLLDRVLAV
jgi:diguanylate cyclase (GGDEF)-like protein/PAS domain S-box-containing protein